MFSCFCEKWVDRQKTCSTAAAAHIRTFCIVSGAVIYTLTVEGNSRLHASLFSCIRCLLVGHWSPVKYRPRWTPRPPAADAARSSFIWKLKDKFMERWKTIDWSSLRARTEHWWDAWRGGGEKQGRSAAAFDYRETDSILHTDAGLCHCHCHCHSYDVSWKHVSPLWHAVRP